MVDFFNLKYFFRRFVRVIFRYDYGAAELLLDGVENFLKGLEFYKTVDTIKDLKAHVPKQVKQVPIKDIQGIDLREKDFHLGLEKESLLFKAFRFVTWNGHFLPPILFIPFGYAEYGYKSNSKFFFLRKHVLACNKNFDIGAEFEIDRTRCIGLIFRFFRLSLSFIRKYGGIRAEYKKEFKTMTSEPFWRKYLKLTDD